MIIAYDSSQSLEFASLQSQSAQRLLQPYGVDPQTVSSLIFLENGIVYRQSTAALRIAARLKAPLSWLGVLLAVPSPVRDSVYNFIARNRYRWFGKKIACEIPAPAVRNRFLP